MARGVFFCLGCLMLTLGFVGVVVPLMPTTIFIILAAWFFARSSPRLEAWLLGHAQFGPMLRAWNESGAVPRRAKIMACAGMSVGFAIFWISAHPRFWLALGVAGLLVASAAYVVTRPSPSPRSVERLEEKRSCT